MRGRSLTPQPFTPPEAEPSAERSGRFAIVRRIPTPPPGSLRLPLESSPGTERLSGASEVVPVRVARSTTPTLLPPPVPAPDEAPGTISEAVTRALGSLRASSAADPTGAAERRPALVSLPPPAPSTEARPDSTKTHASWRPLLATLRRAGVIVLPDEQPRALLESPVNREAIALLLDSHIDSGGDSELRDARMLDERIVDTHARKQYAPDVLVARVRHALDEPLSVVMRAGRAELWLGVAMLSIRRVANHARRQVVRPAKAQTIDAPTFVRAVNRLCRERGLRTRLIPVAASSERARYLRADARMAAELAAIDVCPLGDAHERAEFCAW